MESLAEIWNLYDLLERERAKDPQDHFPTGKKGVIVSFLIRNGGRHTWVASDPMKEIISLSGCRIRSYSVLNLHGGEIGFTLYRVENGFVSFETSSAAEVEVETSKGYYKSNLYHNCGLRL